MNLACKLTYHPGERATWHRRGRRPRPVLIMKSLRRKVRVVDLVESTTRRLVLRDVMAGSLTEARG